jgi:DNA-binding NtrC family response regulator
MARILVVDDVPFIRETIREMLEMWGHTTHEAGDGAETLRMVAEQSFDLITMNIKMPKGDGMSILPLLLQADPSLRIIIVSSILTVEKAVQVMKMGAYDAIEKPLCLNQFFKVVNGALGYQAPRPAQEAII